MTTDSGNTQASGSADSTSTVADALRNHVNCLRDVAVPATPATDHATAQVMSTLIDLLRTVEQTVVSQLEAMGKYNPQVKALAETARNQRLLDVEGAVQTVLRSGDHRLTRLMQYSELLMRWWSAVVTGVQATLLEVPNELAAALDPAGWGVEKKRWSAEAEAYWQHFRLIIRQELPLEMGDRMKHVQAEKTLDAYTVLGSGPSGTP